MTKRFICLITWLIASYAVAAKSSNTIIDTIAPDYDKAVDLCLFHQYAEAEKLLSQIIRRPNHPNHDAAQFLLTEEVYFWRGFYHKYVRFADSTGQPLASYRLPKVMLDQPVTQIGLSVDSVSVGFRLKKKGHVIIEIIVNGKPRKFMVDTGCQRTLVSPKLANELCLTRLLNSEVNNALGQTIPASISFLDFVQLGGLRVANLPVSVVSMRRFGVDGALGWDVLRHICFTIDYQTKTFVLRQPVVDSTATKNLLGGSRPLMVFHSQTGNQLNLFFDSGSNGRVSFSPNGLTKIGTHQVGWRLGGGLGFGGKIRVGRERVVKQTNVAIDKRIFQVRKALITRMNEWICGIISDGIVGSGQFQKGRLTIDYLNNHFDYRE